MSKNVTSHPATSCCDRHWCSLNDCSDGKSTAVSASRHVLFAVAELLVFSRNAVVKLHTHFHLVSCIVLLQLFCIIFCCSLMALDCQEIKRLLTYLLYPVTHTTNSKVHEVHGVPWYEIWQLSVTGRCALEQSLGNCRHLLSLVTAQHHHGRQRHTQMFMTQRSLVRSRRSEQTDRPAWPLLDHQPASLHHCGMNRSAGPEESNYRYSVMS